MILQVDTGEASKYAAKLEVIGSKALPYAVASALNSAAFDVKKTTMPARAAQYFENRQKNFFKANSRVEKVSERDINQMRSTVGFVEGGLKGGNNYAVKDLEQQEEGGTIHGRSIIPLAQARSGGSWQKLVKKPNRIGGAPAFVDSLDNEASGASEGFIRSAIYVGTGGLIMGNRFNAGSRTVFRVRKIMREGKNTVVATDPIYSVKKGRNVNPKPTHFMQQASMQSGANLETYFITAAKKQLQKIK